MSTISAVIPCFNEEKSIGAVLETIPASVSEVVVVDNNSTDNSAAIATEKGAHVVKETRQGYGAALRAGYIAATGDIIVTLDADSQYPAADITRAAKYLEDNNLDFVTCSRFPLDNMHSLNIVRRFGNAFFNVYTNTLFGLHFSDSWSGMMCFRKSILPLLELESFDMPHSQEMKIKAVLNPSIRYGEIHIGYEPRTGDSKLFPLKHGLMMLWVGLSLRVRLAKATSTYHARRRVAAKKV